MVRLEAGPGIFLWRGYFDIVAQKTLAADVMARVAEAPFYRPVMPRSGTPFSVEETNFGSLGWMSDKNGYRYAATHPITQQVWPDIPSALLDLWAAATRYPAPPECCLVNFYRKGARMGLHQDRDEDALDAPVVSVSLGDDAIFRIGGNSRKGPTQSLRLQSGDVLVFGGPSRLAFHGIDRVISGSSRLLPEGGRLNLTLRKVAAHKKAPDQGG